LLSETSVRLFEQDNHFVPGGKHSPGRASDAKNLLAPNWEFTRKCQGQVDFLSLQTGQGRSQSSYNYTNQQILYSPLKNKTPHELILSAGYTDIKDAKTVPAFVSSLNMFYAY